MHTRLVPVVLLTGALALGAPSSLDAAKPKQPKAGKNATKADPPRAEGVRRNTVIEKLVRDISAASIEATIRKLASFGTRHTLSDAASDARGIGAAQRWIKAELDSHVAASGGRLRVELDEFTQAPVPRLPKGARVVNVVATLPGRQAESQDRIYVVSGHYDSRASDPMDATSDAPGANDDASGTAAVIEMCRVMSKLELDATVVFMAVAGEEQGLVGATHWAEEARKKKLNIAGMITNDIIGSSRADDGRIEKGRVRLFAEGIPAAALMPSRIEDLAEARALAQTGGENDSPPRQLARTIKEIGERYVPSMVVDIVYRRDRYLRGGDHSAFLDRGFAAVRFTEPNEDYRHQHQNVRVEGAVSYGDLPEFVDFAYVADVTRVNAAALASLALGPARPSGVEMETAKLENDTTLRWAAGKEPDLAGYRVVWRETTAPFWQHAVDAGNVTTYTVKGVSKDNAIFGVQAVDRDGNASVATYPKPKR